MSECQRRRTSEGRTTTDLLDVEERLASDLELLLRPQLRIPNVPDLTRRKRRRTRQVRNVVFAIAKVRLANERVSNRERAHDGNNVRQATVLLPRDDHLGEAWREREERHRPSQLGDLAADLGARLGRLECAEVDERLLRSSKAVAVGRSGEGEVGDGVDVHALHLKDDALDRHAKDLGLRVLVEVVLVDGRRVDAVAVTGSCSSCATGSLRCGCLGDPRHFEGLDAAADVELALQELR